MKRLGVCRWNWLFRALSLNHNRGRLRRGGIPRRSEALECRVLLSTITVQNLNDAGPGSLRNAVATANAQPGSDTIEFARGLRGSIVLTTGQLSISDELVIAGPGAARLSVSGNNASRIFRIQPGTTVSISDLSLINGRQTTSDAIGISVIRGGAILNEGSSLTLDRMTFAGNRAEATGEGFGSANVVGGGAVTNTTQAALLARFCTFRDNTASGGQVYAFGGAVANVSGSTARFDDCQFISNTVTGGVENYGGALGNFGGSFLNANNSSFVLNRALGVSKDSTTVVNAYGGAVAARPGTVDTSLSNTTFETCRFVSNRAEGGQGGAVGGLAAGGGVYSRNSHLTMEDITLVGNIVQGGAGTSMGGTAYGGGVATDIPAGSFGTVALQKSLVQGNVVRAGAGSTAFAHGGGVSLTGAVSLFETRVIGNVLNAGTNGNARGAGVYLDSPFSFITSSRIVGNVAQGATGQGGGLFGLGTIFVSPQVASQPWRLAQGNVSRGLLDNIVGTLTPSNPPPA